MIPKGKDGQERPGDINWRHAILRGRQRNIFAGDIIGQRRAAESGWAVFPVIP